MKYYKVNFQGIKANFYVNAKNEVCAVFKAIAKFNIESRCAVVGMVTEA